MKENKLAIEINCSAEVLFDITTYPGKAPLWIDAIIREETNEFPIKLGTTYKELNRSGKWSEYTVVKFRRNRIFELAQKDSSYHVRYTYEPISEKKTRLVYLEWVDAGELEYPFLPVVLKKLKKVIERL